MMDGKLQGHIFTLLAVVLFAAQDGFSKHLVAHYPPIFLTMIRFWAFSAFVALVAARSPGGLRHVAATGHPFLQVLRGVLLAGEIVIFVFALAHVGLAVTQALFQATPLLVTALSVPLLGEKVGWRRWAAVVAGLCGVLLIIDPTSGASFDLYLLVPLTCALSFAVYGIATRKVAGRDSSLTSVFYTATVGAIAMTLIGPFYWVPIAAADWPYMLALCVCGGLSHYCLIRAYDVLPASEVQPLMYLQLVVEAMMAVVIFGETLTRTMIGGSAIIVGAGLFTMWREAHLGVDNANARLP